jgi:3alpha(or 20beta)-hydroxysteroid dehydrogenase
VSRFAGKVALISGGARGIGEACAHALHQEGAAVTLGDVLVDDVQRVAADLGPRALAVELDVTSEASWAAATARANEEFGPVTALLNNAGLMRRAGVEETTLEQYREVVDVNQIGPLLGIRAVIADMRRAGGGAIVNVSSVGGLGGMPGAIAYGSTKWAVRGLTRSAAVELGPDGIRVNAVFPGPISTSMLPFPEDSFGYLPLARVGSPSEVAAVVVFLLSDDSSFVTAAEYVVDGGLTGMMQAANRARWTVPS